MGCDWVFKAMKGSSADYHQEMNAACFDKCFEDKLILYVTVTVVPGQHGKLITHIAMQRTALEMN